MTGGAARAPDPDSGTGGSRDIAVHVRGLVKRYGGRAVVDGLDLTVRRGEVFALLGPNGAGKTTTVEILEGYRQPDGGTVRVLGLDPARDAPALRRRVGLMLQSGGVYQYGRPRELLHLFAAFYRNPLDPDALLEQVGLAHLANRAYRVLSGGERQRLALALALIGRPELAILDEPTAGMDPAVRAQTRDLIAGLRRSGVTILLTTHDLGDVEALADRVAVIGDGRLLAEGDPVSLASTGEAGVNASFSRTLSAVEMADLRAMLPAFTTVARPAGITVIGGAADPAVAAAIAAWAARNGVAIVGLSTGGQSLESRYLALVGHDAAAGTA
jgi:ABC-2 type transport system ATP-binding protein